MTVVSHLRTILIMNITCLKIIHMKVNSTSYFVYMHFNPKLPKKLPINLLLNNKRIIGYPFWNPNSSITNINLIIRLSLTHDAHTNMVEPADESCHRKYKRRKVLCFCNTRLPGFFHYMITCCHGSKEIYPVSFDVLMF